MNPQKRPPPPMQPGLVYRIARLLDKPDRFTEWVALATEIELFGDTLPIEWQQCRDPRAMARVLAQTDLVAKVHARLPVAPPPNPEKRWELITHEGVSNTVLLRRADALRIRAKTGRVVELVITYDTETQACSAIRELVPLVCWGDLKP